jgi:tetratricopeptide (TPR) repeat protein
MPKKSITKQMSRREARDLDIEIGFLEGVVRRDPEYVDALQILGDNYTRRGRFTKGLEVDLRLCRLRPDDALTHYNLACSLALTGEAGQAIDTLHRALDLGYRDFKWMRRDPDLRGLRQHPLYKSIRARIRKLEEREPRMDTNDLE